MHSANWPDKVDLKGKRVGLIGVGSTATQVSAPVPFPSLFCSYTDVRGSNQIVPSIQPEVKHLTCFVRSKSWVRLLVLSHDISKTDAAGFA